MDRHRAFPVLLTGLALALSSPAAAQDQPITKSDDSALDIAKTPVTDLNIDPKDIPEVLLTAQKDPYDLKGLNTCPKLAAAVQNLFEVLGPDIDIPQEERDRISAARVAKWVVASFIPFRGLIREISGANEHEREVRAAVHAGMSRRGFLKGVGAARGCAYPAAPATKADIARIHAELDKLEAEHKNDTKGDTKDGDRKKAPDSAPETTSPETTSRGVPIVNRPVVQPTD